MYNTLWLNLRILPKDGPGAGFSVVRGVAAFNDGSLLLADSTEGTWEGDNLGGQDFVVIKLSASRDIE